MAARLNRKPAADRAPNHNPNSGDAACAPYLKQRYTLEVPAADFQHALSYAASEPKNAVDSFSGNARSSVDLRSACVNSCSLSRPQTHYSSLW